MFGFQLPWIRNRERLEKFLAARKGITQSDDEFVRLASPHASGDEREIILILRRVAAMECDVEPYVLRAEDHLEELESLLGGKDWLTYSLLLRDANAFNPVDFRDSLFHVVHEHNRFKDVLAKETFSAISRSWPWQGNASSSKSKAENLGQWAASLAPELALIMNEQARKRQWRESRRRTNQRMKR